jgi:hypothetical protein
MVPGETCQVLSAKERGKDGLSASKRDNRRAGRQPDLTSMGGEGRHGPTPGMGSVLATFNLLRLQRLAIGEPCDWGGVIWQWPKTSWWSWVSTPSAT